MTKKLPPHVKKSRKPTRVACSNCHLKHLQCDDSRPCKNCVKRGIGDTCTNAVRKKKRSTPLSDDPTTKTKKKPSKSKIQPTINSTNISGSVKTSATSSVPNTDHTSNSLQKVPTFSENIVLPHTSTSNIQSSNIDSVDKTDDKNTQKIDPEIKDSSNESSKTTAKTPKKRGRPTKSKSETSDKLTTTTTKKQRKPRAKKQQKLNTGEAKVVTSTAEQAEQRPNNNEQQNSNELSGLGLLTPGGTSTTLPPPTSLLNLANISLSNLNLPTITGTNTPTNHTFSNLNSSNVNSHSNSNLNLAVPSLSDLRLPSFSDLKNFSTLAGDVKTPQFDLKLPTFPSDLKNQIQNQTIENGPETSNKNEDNGVNELVLENQNRDQQPTDSQNKVQLQVQRYDESDEQKQQLHSNKSLPTQQRMEMIGLPNISTTGLQTLLNLNSTNNNETVNENLKEQNNNGKSNSQSILTNKTSNSDSRTNSNAIPNNILSISVEPSHSIDPETPGSALEFSVGSTRTDIHENINLNQTLDPRFSQDIISSESSVRNFESTMANDEYAQLTDLLNTNAATPNLGYLNSERQKLNLVANVGNTGKLTPSKLKNIQSTSTQPKSPELENEQIFVKGISPTDSDNDDDDDARPYIVINLEDGTMVSSYTDNSTPNSYVYNADHSQIPNTAKEIPKDFEQADDYTSPLIMRHVIKQPDDIYLTSIVKAYQYPKAYHALIAYLKKRFNKRQLLEIAKCMAKYRPSFISATKSLFENDLIFCERSFQRTLLEYENLISMSPSPTIIWRRTGEIVALTNEFVVMTGYSRMSLLSKRTFIVELMDDESTINYFRSFSEFAFGDLNATYLTDCNLRKAEDNNYLRCCCVWTIKRDVFDIPMLIVGQFLPVLE